MILLAFTSLNAAAAAGGAAAAGSTVAGGAAVARANIAQMVGPVVGCRKVEREQFAIIRIFINILDTAIVSD